MHVTEPMRDWISLILEFHLFRGKMLMICFDIHLNSFKWFSWWFCWKNHFRSNTVALLVRDCIVWCCTVYAHTTKHTQFEFEEFKSEHSPLWGYTVKHEAKLEWKIPCLLSNTQREFYCAFFEYELQIFISNPFLFQEDNKK